MTTHQTLKMKKIIKRLIFYISGPIYRKFYSPKRIFKQLDDEHNIIKNIQIEDFSYVVAKVKNSLIYTDRLFNISVSVDRELIPLVSWQYSNGKVLPDRKNKLLTREISPKSRPEKHDNLIISLVTGGGGNHNYYHWLFDSISRLYIAQSLINNGEKAKYLIPDNRLPFQKETLTMLGISTENQISSYIHSHLKVSQCIVTSHPNQDPSKIPNWIIGFLRDKLLPHSSGENFSPYVYIERGDSSNGRQLLNEKELINCLKKLGFRSFRLSELTVASQISLFSKAKMVVGVHGAGFTNLTFASEGCIVYELFAESYTPQMYKNISNCLSLDYNPIYCSEISSELNQQKASFRISPNEIEIIKKHAEQVLGADT